MVDYLLKSLKYTKNESNSQMYEILDTLYFKLLNLQNSGLPSKIFQIYEK